MPDSELEALKAQAKDFVARTTANAASAEKVSLPEPMPIPNLPPGTTLDLTHPTLQVSNVEFKIPDVLSVTSTSEVIGPNSLSTGDWIVIARNNNLLRAYTLDDPLDEQNNPPRATTLALDYMVPESADFVEDMHLQSAVLSELTYSSATASYVRAGFDTQSASLSIPYAAASFERQSKEREARASTRKTIYMFGNWFYPRAKLYLKKFTKASARFTDELEAAVKKNEPAAVEQVFNTYGRAVPEEVVIGGQLFFLHTEVCDGSVNETEVEQTIKAAVNAKYQGVQASAGISFGSGSSSMVTAEQINQRTSFDARGGDTILASNPKSWPDTVKDPNKWAVIRLLKLAPITNWLEPALRARVERLLPAIQPPQYVAAEDRTYTTTDSDGFIFGGRTAHVFNIGMSAASVRGSLEFVCGTSGSPAWGQSDAVGASATLHGWHQRDMWIDGASICLPVPKGSRYSVKTWDDDRDRNLVRAPSRFQKAETKLTFGKWQTLKDEKASVGGPLVVEPRGQDSDGFIFCSVRAPDGGDRGFVWCQVDGKILGAASVHNEYQGGVGCWSPYACFCVPVPRHLPMFLQGAATYGKLDIKVWYLPSTSQGWKFGTPEPYTLNALHTAETDGFLNGAVSVREGNNARGMLFLYYGPDKDRMEKERVIPAMAAVHQTSNRFLPYASAMLPIRRGYVFRPESRELSADDPGHEATVEAYWTPLLPAA